MSPKVVLSGGRPLTGGFDIDLRTARDFDFEGETFALIFEGERGISGESAMMRNVTCVLHLRGYSEVSSIIPSLGRNWQPSSFMARSIQFSYLLGTSLT